MDTTLVAEHLLNSIHTFAEQIESLEKILSLLQQKTDKILPEIKILKETIEQSHGILKKLEITQEKLRQQKYLAHIHRTRNVKYNRYQLQNLSDFKQVEKRLLEKEELLELVLNNIPQAIFWKDTDSIYLGCNKTWAKAVGITNVQDVVGKTDYDIACQQEIAVQYIEQDRRVINTGISELHAIEQKLHANGKPVWIDVSKIPIHNHEGKIVGVLGMWEDITERKQAEEALYKSEARNQALLNAIPDLMVRMSRDGIFLDFRPAKNFKTIMPSSEILGKSLYEVMPLEIAQQRMYYVEQALKTGYTQIYEFQLVNDGNTTYEEARIVVSGEDEIIAIIRDITERKQIEVALQQVKEEYRKSEQQFRAIFENAAIGIGLTDIKGRHITTNPALQKMLGYSNKELCNMSFVEATHPNDVTVDVELYKELVIGRLETYQIEKRYCCKNGQSVWGRLTVSSIRDNRNKLQFTVAVVEDITERKQAEETLLHNAFHDNLTNLPNRVLFLKRLNSAIQHAQKCEGYLFAVLFLDLDRFKNVNDSLGHLFGDQMLIAIAKKLEASLRTGDVVARLGGDEFAILLEDLKSVSDSIYIAERIQKEVSLPLNLNGYEVFTNVSIGIALSSTGYEQPEELLRDADIAMYRAKALGKARYEVFDKNMHVRAVALLQLETDLQRAIERQEFVLHYQPIISLKTNQIVGFEALLRWQHPERSLIFPKDFISVAEETGLICLLSSWVLREACRQLRVWQTQFPSSLPLGISVNLSGKQFSQPDLVERIAEVLRETSLDASSLKLEITESAIMENVESASAMLWQLKQLGIQLHMDDFGTGYSSLSYLRCFPIDTLKIDRSFVNQMSLSNENLEIVRTIIMLAHNLGIEAIAEGVETIEHLEQLKSLQCDYGQGYFFSKPVEVETAQLLITKSRMI